MSEKIRGIRNNNPFNMKKTSINWDGESKHGKDTVFETFTNPYFGLRAGVKLLLNYEKKHNINTVNKLINRFAPATENNTSAYIKVVCDFVGVAENEEISIKEHIFKLSKAIIKHENGFIPYSDELINAGIELAS